MADIRSVPPQAQAALRDLIQQHGVANLVEALAAIVDERRNPIAGRCAGALAQAASKIRDTLAHG